MSGSRGAPARRSREPLLWALFSAGGTLAALALPALVGVLWLAAPLGWVPAASHAELATLARAPAARLFLFALLSLALFHWAHRFRYTLYDGLQLYHLNRLIAVCTYGAATLGTVLAAWLIWVRL